MVDEFIFTCFASTFTITHFFPEMGISAHPISGSTMFSTRSYLSLDSFVSNDNPPTTPLNYKKRCSNNILTTLFFPLQSYILITGFSDPYCMLGIQPAGAPPVSPQPMPTTPRTLSDVGFDNNTDSPSHDKLRKHSFRLSFKRKDGSARREQRDSLGGPVPAKFIRATSIKPHTLCPKWMEKFKL